MITVYFDTETTGLPDFNKRASDPSQPHLVQLAMVKIKDDCETLEQFNEIISPDGWEIPLEASKVHGITQEKAQAEGIPEKSAAQAFLQFIDGMDLLVAHNLKFDKFLLRIALRRYGLLSDEQDEWWKALPTFCTMEATTPICRIPGNRVGAFKWPRLQEAHKFAFGCEFLDAHDALADVLACARIHRWLKASQAKEVANA